ncbi:MAG TPA: secondary thiamine-phosphate synthase enzyme YjbQ [Burkholderiales bacterium]|nr:secondary thiamine-phosphate synthase enzyme YjbQ [Burkholderiales bacterium]
MTFQETLRLRTRGRGTTDLSAEVERVVRSSGVASGTCNVFLQHTSASLILCENADPTVRRDLETIMARLAPDGDPAYAHDAEGPDDMASHARSVLTSNSLVIPVSGGRLALGTWQGIYLWEHRQAPHARSVIVTVAGDNAP